VHGELQLRDRGVALDVLAPELLERRVDGVRALCELAEEVLLLLRVVRRSGNWWM